VVVDLAGDVALEAADGFSFAEPLCGASLDVGNGGRVLGADADHDDGPERGVRLAVAGAAESVAVRPAGGDAHGCAAAQGGVAGFAAKPFGVVARGAQQRAGGLVADAVSLEHGCGNLVED